MDTILVISELHHSTRNPKYDHLEYEAKYYEKQVDKHHHDYQCLASHSIRHIFGKYYSCKCFETKHIFDGLCLDVIE